MKLVEEAEKLLKKKKIGKDQCVILILAGILLCIIALPVKDDTESHLWDTKNGKIQKITDAEGETAETSSDDTEELYEAYWEKRLEETLSCIEGAGRVKVLITLRESEGKVVEKEGKEESEETQESDAGGGSRTITVRRVEKDTVYTVNGQGQNVPYVVKTTAPVVEGIVVVAQGGDNISVKENIIASVQVLFNLDVNKIRVVKMKNINQ